MLLLALGMWQQSAIAQTQLKIGFVNAAKILDQSPQAEQARKRLEQEFAPRDKALVDAQRSLRSIEDKLVKDGAVMSEAERRLAAELQEAQKRFDTGGARVMAATPGGRRRVPEAIARHFGVAEKSVVELRAKRMTYGEVSVALSLSRQWTARDRTLTARQSLDRIVALRKTHEWVAVARQLNLRLEDVIGDLKTAEKQLAKLDPVTAARVERQEPKGTRLPR